MLNTNYMALAEALFAYSLKRNEEVTRHRRKLAHYTTAENALNIISGQTIWLRNAAVMNDHSEIEHGRAVLNACLKLPTIGDRFARVLDGGHAGLSARVLNHVANQRALAREKIFVISLSEHEEDDCLGRLSMWRAYGGTTAGAALVFNAEIFDDAQLNLMSFASPVLYGGFEQFAPELEAVIHRLEQNPALLRGVTSDVAFSALSTALDFAILSTKHLGFSEEREWRVIHRPFEHSSAHVEEGIVAISGTPQLIYRLPLVNKPGMNMPRLTLDRLLQRVIIGPSLHPETTRRAIVEALRAKGVTTPEPRVVLSDIPLRQLG